MPSEVVGDVQRWRALAKTTRAKADRMKDGRSKRMLRAMANFYERMAERVDGRLRKPKKSN
jgi:hypothetical protein